MPAFHNMDHLLVHSCLTTHFQTLFLLLVTFMSFHAGAQTADKKLRIITLSPHLTEIVFALGRGEQLIAVSDYSNYPAAASTLKSVASYQGANIAEIIRLQPTHILAWRGGNKDADIEKLKTLDMPVYESSINSVDSLLADIINIGDNINAKDNAEALVRKLEGSISAMANDYKDLSKTAIYYLSTQPLVGLGNDKWLNSVLRLCGLANIYTTSPSAYPQLQMADIIRKQPEVLIAAMKSNSKQIEKFWAPHKKVLNSEVVIANPDALHRFTPRAIFEMTQLCKRIYH
jgi:vitamin B12 transport system substrate-binding protein